MSPYCALKPLRPASRYYGYMRRSLVFLAMLASAASYAQTAGKISIDLEGTPLSRAMETLSTATGKTLKVHPSLAREVVLVHATDKDAQDILDRVAAVVGGEWSTEPDGSLKLSKKSSVWQADERDRSKQRVAAIRAALAKMAKPEEKTANGMPIRAGGLFEAGATTNGPHVDTAFRALAPMLDAASLAAIPEEGRAVYTLVPNRAQLALVGSVEPMLQGLIAGHNDYVKAAEERRAKEEEAMASNPMAEQFTKMREWLTKNGIEMEPKRIGDPVAKMIVIATRGGTFLGSIMRAGSDLAPISLEIRLYGPQGQNLIRATQTLELDASQSPWWLPQDPGTKKEEDKSEAVELSPLTKELMQFMTMTEMSTNFDRKASKELEEVIAHPEIHDPLAFLPTDGIIGVAKSRKLDVVANIPENLSSATDLFLNGGKVTVGAYTKTIEAKCDLTEDKAGGWLTVRPKSLGQTSRTRGDRMALATLIKASKSKEIPGLDDYAAYALRNEPPMSNTTFLPYVMLFAPNLVNQGMRGPVDWNLLRLWGSLGQGQRDSIRAGGRIAFQNLNTEQMAILRQMVYGANARLVPDEPAKPNEESGGFMDMALKMFLRPSKDYRDEPTEVVPNGLPGTGSLEIIAEDEPLAIATGKGNMLNRMMGGLGTDELAMLQYFSEEPMFAAAGSMMPKIEALKFGKRHSMKVLIHIAPGVRVDGSLIDDSIPKDAPSVPYADMPAEIKAKIAKRVATFKDNPIGMFMGMGQQPQARP